MPRIAEVPTAFEWWTKIAADHGERIATGILKFALNLQGDD